MGLRRHSTLLSDSMARLVGLVFQGKPPPLTTLEIMAFDAAKTMCRLVSLYHSLGDEDILKLRNETIKSTGVNYLNSKDESFLLNLACAERLQELDVAAGTVMLLGRRCSDFGLKKFDLVYTNLKLGIVDKGKLEFGTRSMKKIIGKMEKLIDSTSELYKAMESLTELLALEKKAQRSRQNVEQKQCMSLYTTSTINSLNDRIAHNQKLVQYYKEVSLWNQTYDKTVGFMARIVCVIFARINFIFGSFISGTVCLYTSKHNRSSDSLLNFSGKSCPLRPLADKETVAERVSKSGPIPKTSKKGPIGITATFFKPFVVENIPTGEKRGGGEMGESNSIMRLTSTSTVGEAGLSFRYANLIIYAERCLQAHVTIGEDARGVLYKMLPTKLRTTMASKLRKHWCKEGEGEGELVPPGDGGGYQLAEGWRQALEEIMEWLAPMAHDTVRWQSERSLEKQRFETQPTAMLLQTLHYSDLEKTEAAIVEVLVGLSCIYRYERRQSNSRRDKRKRR